MPTANMREDVVMNTSKIEPIPKATVEVFDGTTSLGVATLNGSTWTLAVSKLSLGVHRLSARSATATSSQWTLTVTEKEEYMNLTPATVLEAHSITDNSQRIDYYLDVNNSGLETIHVIVPDYNMKTGDSVKVKWLGRGNHEENSPTQTVGNPPSLQPFAISKYEVIDVIGFNASIGYSVKRPPSDTLHQSPVLRLAVEGHAGTIVAPTINADHNNLRVQKAQFNSNSTAAVRCIGGNSDSDVWSSDDTTFGSASYLNFSINNNWLARNRGRSVKFDWSVRVNPGDGHNYKFSQLLRIPSL
jgi:hypothetical protein